MTVRDLSEIVAEDHDHFPEGLDTEIATLDIAIAGECIRRIADFTTCSVSAEGIPRSAICLELDLTKKL